MGWEPEDLLYITVCKKKDRGRCLESKALGWIDLQGVQCSDHATMKQAIALARL
jgi:hypothetical protein